MAGKRAATSAVRSSTTTKKARVSKKSSSTRSTSTRSVSTRNASTRNASTRNASTRSTSTRSVSTRSTSTRSTATAKGVRVAQRTTSTRNSSRQGSSNGGTRLRSGTTTATTSSQSVTRRRTAATTTRRARTVRTVAQPRNFDDIILDMESLNPTPRPTNKSFETVGEVSIVSLLMAETALEANDECAICLEEYYSGETIQTLSCTHVYHQRCLLPWLQQNASCPSCRKDM